MGYDADVIVAGAGPAGTLAAYGLASSGYDTLILEKSGFPRYKVCGAGLTHKILQELPYDVSPVLETAITRMVFSHSLDNVFIREADRPMIYCTTRETFDSFLLGKATGAGARVSFHTHVTGYTADPDGITVHSRHGNYRAKVLLGTDGASGNTARIAGLKTHIASGMAWEAEIRVSNENLKEYGSTVFLDWGTFPGGYAWVFPKKDHFSIGVGGPAELSSRMMPYYERLAKYLSGSPPRNLKFAEGTAHNAFNPLEIHDTLSLKAWPIPVRTRKAPFHAGRVLVAGDAAGLTDPLTGEGLYYAVRSGKLAAEAIDRYLRGNRPNLESFSESVNRFLMPELLEARRIGAVFNAVPGTIHRYVRDNERAWRAFGKILRGERCYADVKSGFGSFSFLWGAACGVAGWRTKVKTKRFAKRGFD